MAKLIINDRDVTVSLSAVKKLDALHGNVVVPRSAVAQVRTVPNGMVEVHGLRAPGTGFPGVSKSEPGVAARALRSRSAVAADPPSCSTSSAPHMTVSS